MQNIFTDANLCDPLIFHEILRLVAAVDEEVALLNFQLPPDCDLVLELEETSEDGIWNWLYYFADHTNRVLFWLQEFDVSPHIESVKGAKDPAHISGVFY